LEQKKGESFILDRGALEQKKGQSFIRFRGTQSRTEPLPRGNGYGRWVILLNRNRQAPLGGERGAYLFSAQILVLRPCRAAADQSKSPDPRGFLSRPLPGQVAVANP